MSATTAPVPPRALLVRDVSSALKAVRDERAELARMQEQFESKGKAVATTEDALRQAVRSLAAEVFPSMRRFYQIVAAEYNLSPRTIEGALSEPRLAHVVDYAASVVMRAADGQLDHYLVDQD